MLPHHHRARSLGNDVCQPIHKAHATAARPHPNTPPHTATTSIQTYHDGMVWYVVQAEVTSNGRYVRRTAPVADDSVELPTPTLTATAATAALAATRPPTPTRAQLASPPPQRSPRMRQPGIQPLHDRVKRVFAGREGRPTRVPPPPLPGRGGRRCPCAVLAPSSSSLSISIFLLLLPACPPSVHVVV